MKYFIKVYVLNVLIGLDQFVNSILYPLLNPMFGTTKFGSPDETLSSVFGKLVESGESKAAIRMCKFLHMFDENHCAKSIEKDERSNVNEK